MAWSCLSACGRLWRLLLGRYRRQGGALLSHACMHTQSNARADVLPYMFTVSRSAASRSIWMTPNHPPSWRSSLGATATTLRGTLWSPPSSPLKTPNIPSWPRLHALLRRQLVTFPVPLDLCSLCCASKFKLGNALHVSPTHCFCVK